MYFFKRGLAALIDVLFYAVIMKICEPILGNEINGDYYTHTGLAILCFYIIMLVQDLLFKRTIGKRLLSLKFEFLEDKNGQNDKQKLRLIFRRLFDVLEIICAFIYIIPVLVTEKRQKLGDHLSNIVVVESK